MLEQYHNPVLTRLLLLRNPTELQIRDFILLKLHLFLKPGGLEYSAILNGSLWCFKYWKAWKKDVYIVQVVDILKTHHKGSNKKLNAFTGWTRWFLQQLHLAEASVVMLQTSFTAQSAADRELGWSCLRTWSSAFTTVTVRDGKSEAPPGSWRLIRVTEKRKQQGGGEGGRRWSLQRNGVGAVEYRDVKLSEGSLKQQSHLGQGEAGCGCL